jgi:hypothetical protein
LSEEERTIEKISDERPNFSTLPNTQIFAKPALITASGTDNKQAGN